MRKDFCLCFNDGYVPYASVTIKSIINHSSEKDDIHIHVVSDYISPKHLQMLSCIANIHYYNVDDSIFEGIEVGIWSIYTWYRILLPTIIDINIHRVLYIDCDIIINDCLDELFTMPLEDKSIAACIDIQSYGDEVFNRLQYDKIKKYVCAGVLVMNIDKWRKDNISDKILDFVRKNQERILFPDQDAINYVCQNDKIILNAEYGVLVPFFFHREFILEHINKAELLIEHPKIIHYAGYQPWIYAKNKSIHSGLWWKTYFSLHKYPMVIISYFKSIIKYYIRYILSYTRIIKSQNKYYLFSQYYYHPKLNKKRVLKNYQIIKQTDI